MIIIKKKYAIDEKMELINEDENGNQEVLYEFRMQLTDEDLEKLQKALFGENILKLAEGIREMEKKTLTKEEEEEVIKMGKELNSAAENLIEELCLKEHKDEFIRLGGIIKYDEAKQSISDYLTSFFMNRQVSRVNIINSDLAKISQN